jgi:hypothetical protein
MKQLRLLPIVLSGAFFFAAKADAQTPVSSTYFVGKWDILAKGVPNGDTHMFFTLADSVGTVKGTFLDPESKTDVPLTKTEIKDSVLTLYFTAQSYDVNLTLIKKGTDSVAGSLMGMFDAAGVRIKK